MADGEIKLGTSSLKPKININGSQLKFNNTILNKYILTTILQDISTIDNTCFVVAPMKGTITKIYWIIDGSINTTDNAIIYVNINGSLNDVSNNDSSDDDDDDETGGNTTVPENIIIPNIPEDLRENASTVGKTGLYLPKKYNLINEGEYIKFKTNGGSTDLYVDKKVNVVFTIEITY